MEGNELPDLTLLNEEYSAALQLRGEERKKARSALSARADQLLAQSVETALSPQIARDVARIQRWFEALLSCMQKERHLWGGVDRWALEKRLRDVFRSAFDKSEPVQAVVASFHLPCKTDGCPFRVDASKGKTDLDVSVYAMCVLCGRRCCWRCGNAAPHTLCSELAEQLKECAAAGLETSSCPNCGAMVSKDGGCDRMRCETCGRQWDWTTGATGKDLTIEHIWRDK